MWILDWLPAVCLQPKKFSFSIARNDFDIQKLCRIYRFEFGTMNHRNIIYTMAASLAPIINEIIFRIWYCYLFVLYDRNILRLTKPHHPIVLIR